MPATSSLAAVLQPAVSGAEPPRQRRARKTNSPFDCTDKNTAQGRRVADLMRAYYRALGSPTEVERQAAIVAAAELVVIAEQVRTAALKSGGTVDLDAVVRVQGAADRALRLLGLNLKATPSKASELDDYLANQPAEPETVLPEGADEAVENLDSNRGCEGQGDAPDVVNSDATTQPVEPEVESATFSTLAGQYGRQQ